MTEPNAEEKELLAAYQEDRLERVSLSAEEIEAYRTAARAVGRKSERVNIRISAQDLEDLKIKALEEGMPYQTLMASVLHKFVSGNLVSKA